ncbi:hypothetical protein H2204_002587 [Knufia peltigerae]|uniref:FAD/NAD(P)-binding domain-containing protein n=1 Tax=Knufia peltigerae TaxID=1002370 RepID=A0AA39D167_9EURO|nr:hypothetical protein H2204_002587 [Knufia peltigerae]
MTKCHESLRRHSPGESHGKTHIKFQYDATRVLIERLHRDHGQRRQNSSFIDIDINMGSLDIAGGWPKGALPPIADIINKPVDAPRPIKVIMFGAGLAGVMGGILIPRTIRNLELVIYDMNPSLGGFTFENNTQWSSYYAPGPEILKYLQCTADKYGATRHMKLQHKILKAKWHESEGKWHVDVQNLVTGEIFTDKSDAIITGLGNLNVWKLPDIPGLQSFKGKIMHSAGWDTSYDYTDKKVALIGAGSSGIQILPNILPKVKHVDHYMKSRTWITPGGIGSEGLLDRDMKPQTPTEDLEKFRKHPEEYLKYRHKVEEIMNKPVPAFFDGTPAAAAIRQLCADHMKKKLGKKPEVYESLLPDFPPGCRRLTPGPGYLEALCEDNVNFIPTKIERVNETGIQTVDGVQRDVDLIICATGFDDTYKVHIPTYGLDGIRLEDVWEEVPEAYLSVCPRKMPNYFIMGGPNGGPGQGSALPFLENEMRYIISCIEKIQREYIKWMVPKDSAVKSFGKLVDKYFKPTVFAVPCNAWWKNKRDPHGRLLPLWPGTSTHGSYVFKHPRWEDFEYKLREETDDNPLAWIGNGFTEKQVNGEFTSGYLDEAYVPVEIPWEKKASVEMNGHSHTNGVGA